MITPLTVVYDESGNPPKGWEKKVKKIMNPPKKKQECLKTKCPVCSKCQCEFRVMMRDLNAFVLKWTVQQELMKPFHDAMRGKK